MDLLKTSYAKKIISQLLAKAGVQINGPNPYDFQVHDERTYQRILTQGTLGLGEAYVDGWWDAESVDGFVTRTLNARLKEEVQPLKVGKLLKATFLNLQSQSRSKKVADIHYDLGNAFYEKMLDPWMQYTCAYWPKARGLNQAQEHKLDLICRKLELKPGHRVLELGSGWGGFARYAATHYGVEVVAYNISREQVRYAREACRHLPVTFHQEDYRLAQGGPYDRVVSVGLCEHVGYKNLKNFFKISEGQLKEGGLFLVHTIGSNRTGVSIEPWLDKYIFPGAVLPSVTMITQACDDSLVVEDWHNFGSDYDKTLMAWFDNFNYHWESIRSDQYNEHFYRLWKYYLLTCAGTFRSRRNQLWQIVFSKNGRPGGYLSVR